MSDFCRVPFSLSIRRTPYPIFCQVFIIVELFMMFSTSQMLVTSVEESLCASFDWALTVVRGQRGNFMFSLLVSGLPLPLLVPRLNPHSFVRKLYKGEIGVFTVYPFIASPPPPLLHSLCAPELFRNPRAQPVDALQDLRAKEQDGEERYCQCINQVGAL
jgi:hypothetical protein